MTKTANPFQSSPEQLYSQKKMTKNKEKIGYYKAEPQQHQVACVFEDISVMAVTRDHVNQDKVGKTSMKS